MQALYDKASLRSTITPQYYYCARVNVTEYYPPLQICTASVKPQMVPQCTIHHNLTLTKLRSLHLNINAQNISISSTYFNKKTIISLHLLVAIMFGLTGVYLH